MSASTTWVSGIKAGLANIKLKRETMLWKKQLRSIVNNKNDSNEELIRCLKYLYEKQSAYT